MRQLTPDAEHVSGEAAATPPVDDMPLQNIEVGALTLGMAVLRLLVSLVPVNMPPYVPTGVPVGPTTGALAAMAMLGSPIARVVGMGVGSPLK